MAELKGGNTVGLTGPHILGWNFQWKWLEGGGREESELALASDEDAPL